MKDDFKNSYCFVDTVSGLKDVACILEKENTIAVDLEADSMFHFREKVCLIQIASKGVNAVIDTLEIGDISCLKPIFSNPKIKKIFHGADYDVRSLHRDFNITIYNLFDTEIAVKFLGAKATGLDAVLNQKFNITLDKKYQKKDWSQRPLPGNMVQYAASDAIHLLPLAEILEKELKEKGRLSWVVEENEILSKVRQAPSNDKPLFMKFKGSGRLGPKSLAVLETLLLFRQKIAERKDRPLFKVIGNATLLKIAQLKPISLRHLKNIKGLSPKTVNLYGSDFVKLVNGALKTPVHRLPVYIHKRKLPLKPDVPQRIKALKIWRDKKGEELNIDPTLIFNKAMLNSIAICHPENTKSLDAVKGLRAWKKREFGRDIVDVFR